MTDRTEELRKVYNREIEQAQETIVIALCETYKRITGKQANTSLREKIHEAVEQHG
jgi:hypothetical protein